MYFLIEDDDLLKNIKLFGIKSVLLSKKTLVASLCVTKTFWKTKMKFDSNEITDFYNKEIP